MITAELQLRPQAIKSAYRPCLRTSRTIIKENVNMSTIPNSCLSLVVGKLNANREIIRR